MVHEIAPLGIDEISIWFYFDAEIVRKADANGDNFELRDRVYLRDPVIDYCNCSTDELYILPCDLSNADKELERYLNEFYPEYEFRHVEITGYRIRN